MKTTQAHQSRYLALNQSPDIIATVQEISSEIDLNPATAADAYFEYTEVNTDSRPRVFLSILNNQPDLAFRIIECIQEDDYSIIADDIMSQYPAEITVLIFKQLLANRDNVINIPLLLFANSNFMAILSQMPDEVMDMLSTQVTEGMLDDKTISSALIDIYKNIGLKTFIRLTQRISRQKTIEFFQTRILHSCRVQKLRNFLGYRVEQAILNGKYNQSSIISPPEGTIDSEITAIVNDYIEYLEDIAPENRYDAFIHKSGIHGELFPQFFSNIFYRNRDIVYIFLKNIRGQHRHFSDLIFKRLSRFNKRYLLERTLVENTRADQRSKIELAEILVYSGEVEVIQDLSCDCLYKLFVHMVRDYLETENQHTRAEIRFGFEKILSSISPQKLKPILAEFKSRIFLQFFKTIPVCRGILESNSILNSTQGTHSSVDSFGMSKKDLEVLSWLQKQNMTDPITTVDIIDTLDLILQTYLSEIGSLVDTIPSGEQAEQDDIQLQQIIDELFLPFKRAKSSEKPVLWFEFYMKMQQLILMARNKGFSIVDNDLEIESKLFLIFEYFNNLFSKWLNEEILIKKDAIEVEPVFFPEGFEKITGRVKVIGLSHMQSEEDMALYYRQFKYLKPSNLAIANGFPADYSSTGKAGAIITGALADRDRNETAHSYKRAMELGAPLVFFPNAREGFQHLDDQWITIYQSGQKAFLRASTPEEIDRRIQETKNPSSHNSISDFIPDSWPDIDIIDCRDSAANVSHQTGRKSEMLGQLINVFPNETETDSFAWSFAPYAKKRKFASVEEMPQIEYIHRVLKSYDLSDHIERIEAARKIQHSFSLNPLDITTTYFKELWCKIIETFGYSETITQGFMMRLTMNLEDRAEISAAGVYASLPVLPGTHKTRLAQLINELYKSAYTAKAIEIREMMNVSHIDTYAAILFERMPDWKNPVLSGNLILNSNHMTGGFVVGHGHYLMNNGNRPSLLFYDSANEDHYPLMPHEVQAYKRVPQSDYKHPYAQLPLTKKELNLVSHPRDCIDPRTTDTIIDVSRCIRQRFGSTTSWDIELTVELDQDNEKIRLHQLRPLVK